MFAASAALMPLAKQKKISQQSLPSYIYALCQVTIKSTFENFCPEDPWRRLVSLLVEAYFCFSPRRHQRGRKLSKVSI